MLFRLTFQIITSPPQETWHIRIVSMTMDLTEHRFNIGHKGDPFLSELSQNTNEGVGYIWTL